MNQQPFEGLTQFLASLFILYTLYNFVKYSQNPNAKGFSDIYELGYVYDKNLTNTIAINATVDLPKIKKVKQQKQAMKPEVIKPIHEKKENTTKVIKKKTTKHYNQLQQDCYDALIALGMKKKEATFVVNSTFNKTNVSTVQDFLQIALIVPKK
jgi:Holliday junction resolvasome RuvABC DNA-binding subunit